MDEITKLTSSYGITLGIIIWVVFGLVKLAERLGPDVWSFFKRDLEDKRENQQKIKEEQLRQESIQLLIAQGSRTFTEEQLTAMTAETQTQLSEANEYIRKDVADKLDAVIQQLIVIKDRVDRLPMALGDKYKEEFAESRRIRASIRMIAYILEKEFSHKVILDESDNEREKSSFSDKSTTRSE